MVYLGETKQERTKMKNLKKLPQTIDSLEGVLIELKDNNDIDSRAEQSNGQYDMSGYDWE